MNALETVIEDYKYWSDYYSFDVKQPAIEAAISERSELIDALRKAMSAAESMVAEAGTVGNYAPSMPHDGVEAQAVLDKYTIPGHPTGVPCQIIFFPNGMAAVYDTAGNQMPKYQGAGCHPEVIAALEADEINWRSLTVTGEPRHPSQFVDRLGRPIPPEMYRKATPNAKA